MTNKTDIGKVFKAGSKQCFYDKTEKLFKMPKNKEE